MCGNCAILCYRNTLHAVKVNWVLKAAAISSLLISNLLDLTLYLEGRCLAVSFQ